ncbi:hypothetical protein tb265_42210 [Gemmatimonadetes bacterium T265]|nr:hypothetical protein tb265_42210 [Gemmatimonadetes bacterium T265]
MPHPTPAAPAPDAPAQDARPQDARPQATVAIVTKNRREYARAAIRSALAQVPRVEVLVCDDGSTDGTPEMVRAEFPEAVLHVSERSADIAVQRTRATALASAPFVFCIDDDAAFSSPDTVAEALRLFDHPRVALVAMPFVNVRVSDRVLQRAPAPEGTYVASGFVGTAYGVRRDVFVALGGYRPLLVHQYEEEDFAIRLLDAGYLIRLASTPPIHHFHSPTRNREGMDRWGARNTILFTWHNVPMPYLVAHMAATSVNAFAAGVRAGTTGRKLRGMAAGYADCLRQRQERTPVRGETYRLYRRLKTGGPLPAAVAEGTAWGRVAAGAAESARNATAARRPQAVVA